MNIDSAGEQDIRARVAGGHAGGPAASPADSSAARPSGSAAAATPASPAAAAPVGAAGGAQSPTAAGSHVVTLLSRPGCHLCDEARAVIAHVAEDLGLTWEERDITRSESDTQAYWDKIPVTLIDGVQHDFWRVSEERLRKALGR